MHRPKEAKSGDMRRTSAGRKTKSLGENKFREEMFQNKLDAIQCKNERTLGAGSNNNTMVQ